MVHLDVTIEELAENLPEGVPVPMHPGKGLPKEAWDYVERRIKESEQRARETPKQRAKRLAYMKRWRERKKREAASK